MSILEYSIAALIILAVFMLIIRIILAVSNHKKIGKHDIGCETGASKTIGNREVQEDEFGMIESMEGTLGVLADGAGKQFGGKIAARLSVQVFLDMFEDQNAFYNPQYYFRKAFQGANKEILNQIEDNQGRAAVGVVMVKNRKLYYAVVGNVKIAVYRNKELVPISIGNTVNVLVKQRYVEGKMSKKEAVDILEQGRLQLYVGRDGFRDVEFFDAPVTLYGGEYILLMSDGLYEAVRWKDLESCLEKEGSCQDKAFRMIELVNCSEEKDNDNASVVVLRVR